MKKSNYKLPGLPSVDSTPKSIGKAAPPRESGTTKLAGFSAAKSTPIAFGRASHAATKNSQSSQSGSDWSNLLKTTASGGISGTLSSITGLGGGIGSLISGIENLFGGGKSTPPALAAYQLPTSQEQVVSIGSSQSDTGVYGGPQSTTAFSSQSDHIVQSVKQAILNSSSLNDIIAEI